MLEIHGYNSGFENGKTEGIKEGIEKGIEENKKQIARKMKKAGNAEKPGLYVQPIWGKFYGNRAK